MRELRHDFRAHYGVSYEEVETDEAIDLALSLPYGSAYASSVSPAAAWDGERHQIADVIDLLLVINWRLMGCPQQYMPSPIERPGDNERVKQARNRAIEAKNKIENTQWEEV